MPFEVTGCGLGMPFRLSITPAPTANTAMTAAAEPAIAAVFPALRFLGASFISCVEWSSPSSSNSPEEFFCSIAAMSLFFISALHSSESVILSYADLKSFLFISRPPLNLF